MSHGDCKHNISVNFQDFFFKPGLIFVNSLLFFHDQITALLMGALVLQWF